DRFLPNSSADIGNRWLTDGTKISSTDNKFILTNNISSTGNDFAFADANARRGSRLFRIGSQSDGSACSRRILSRTYFVIGPAIPPNIGVAKAPTIALTALGTRPTRPSTSLATTESSALLPFAASAFNARSFSAASVFWAGAAASIA